MRTYKCFYQDDNGATALEYALIAALVALSIVTGASALGTSLNTLFTDTGEYMSTAQAPAAS